VVTIPSTLVPGTYIINISYTGDANYKASSVITISLIIGKVTPAITLTSSVNPVLASGAVTFTATVSSSTGTPTGTISFYDQATLLATVTLSQGQAVYTTSSFAAGSHSITATYSGDNTFNSVTSSAITETVNKATATVALVSSLNPALVTSAISFTATVSSSTSAPTGTVGFYDGATLLGTEPISNQQATYTTSSLATGTHSITADYSGDGTFLPVTSSAVSELVQDFTISTPTSGTTNAPTATVLPGGTATYTLNIGPSVGNVFPAPVTLSLSGLPPGATGTLSPSTLPAGLSSSPVTLTIQLPQTSQLQEDHRQNLRLAVTMLALLFLPFAGKMRRSSHGLRRLGCLIILLAAGAASLVSLSGCGAKPTGYFGQAEKSYTVSIIATSGSLTHSTSVTLVVQ
jgi:hypothetical protein